VFQLQDEDELAFPTEAKELADEEMDLEEEEEQVEEEEQEEKEEAVEDEPEDVEFAPGLRGRGGYGSSYSSHHSYGPYFEKYYNKGCRNYYYGNKGDEGYTYLLFDYASKSQCEQKCKYFGNDCYGTNILRTTRSARFGRWQSTSTCSNTSTVTTATSRITTRSFACACRYLFALL